MRSILKKSYSELTLADDFMFWKVMSRPEIAKQFLERLLGRSIKSVEFSGGQSTHKEFANRPGVRFDVEFHGDGKIYDIEMQNSGSYSEKGILELTNRARYYHAMLTQSKYNSGGGYAALPDSYVIFICRFDPFGEGRAMYTQTPHIQELAKQLPPHEVTVYLCTRYKSSEGARVSQDILEFLDYIETARVPSDNTLVKSADLEVARLRYSSEERRNYMSLQEMIQNERQDAREEGRQEGLQEGRQEGLQEGLQQGRQEMFDSVAEALAKSGMNSDQIKAILGVVAEDGDRKNRKGPANSGSSGLGTMNLQ